MRHVKRAFITKQEHFHQVTGPGLCFMTLALKLDQNKIKLNQHAESVLTDAFQHF